MNFESNKKKMTTKECAYELCSNTFYGSQFQKYCNDKRCRESRIAAKNTIRKKIVDIDSDNRIITKSTVSRILLSKKSIIFLRCKAKNSNNQRCNNKFKVTLDTNRNIYPKYCEHHRNAYKRKRYALCQS